MPEKTSPPKSDRAKPARTGKPTRPAGAGAARAPAVAPAKTTEGDRIAKVLSRAGIASRREAERLIEAGEVKVNGKLVTSPALNVSASDRITVSGQPVGAPEPARLWLYYKPEGLVTSAADEKGRDTVFDHLPEDMPRVMSVGRLDLNSEGLLLLTNDGELKRRLELPSTGWLRKYRVRVKGNPTDPDLEPLRKGITIEGENFQPMEVILDRHQGANAWLTVGLREGRNREIRRAMTAIGLTVNRLIRISYGPFRLNELKPGEVEEIRPRILRDQLGPLLPEAAGEPSAPVRVTRAPRKPAQAAATGQRERPAPSTPQKTRSPMGGRDAATGSEAPGKPHGKPSGRPAGSGPRGRSGDLAKPSGRAPGGSGGPKSTGTGRSGPKPPASGGPRRGR